jgi:Fusaric acid resistance protein-like
VSVKWVPVWSKPAALRALRAVLVVPPLFALTYKGVGNLQIALFAAFGGFASLVMASFGGTWRDKVTAHFGLAVTGSAALIIGTAVSGNTALATIVTIPVAFGIFFAGVATPNAAGGVTAALLAYVLPVASPGTASMIPDRLAGWWLASAAATVAVLVLPTPAAGNRLRAAAAGLARSLADLLDTLMSGADAEPARAAARTAKTGLMATFAATPFRPTGMATSDQALYSLVQELEWCSALVADAIDEGGGFPADLALVTATANGLRDTADLLDGKPVVARLGDLELACDRCGPSPGSLAGIGARVIASSDGSGSDGTGSRGASAETLLLATARRAFHEQAVAVAARAVLADTLIATRRADPETVAARRRSWYGAPPEGTEAERRVAALHGAIGVLARHASLRSVWALNALRGSVALAAAVLVADVSGVQHAFWVVLGTMSVLRTNATTTESTALRALGGTVIGFVIGALLLLGIGTGQGALWAALPIAVVIAAYAPGVLPFIFGQAAFTVVVVVLFNLLIPVGWKVGLLRIEDVAIGCAVSLVTGVLFWPRGAGSVVGDDLADAYRTGSVYLTQAVQWALGRRDTPPAAGPAAVTAGIRLDEALRGYLAEQGSKRVPRDDLWRLVMAATRLRLSAYSIAALRSADTMSIPGSRQAALTQAATDVAGFYEQLAALVGRPVAGQVLTPLRVPNLDGMDGEVLHHDLLWIREHLRHLGSHAPAVTQPAARVAEQRRAPWWR